MSFFEKMMEHYQDTKKKDPETIMVFRVGDFCECFHDDAKLVAKVLNLTLTKRGKKEDDVPMAGFPYHSQDTYIAKLVAAGYRVSISETVV